MAGTCSANTHIHAHTHTRTHAHTHTHTHTHAHTHIHAYTHHIQRGRGAANIWVGYTAKITYITRTYTHIHTHAHPTYRGVDEHQIYGIHGEEYTRNTHTHTPHTEGQKSIESTGYTARNT